MSDQIIPFDFLEPTLFLLTESWRYKVLYGGRVSGKSHAAARALIYKAFYERKLILCTREFQTSISDSVHRVLAGIINEYGFDKYFDIQRNTIVNTVNGSQFIFKGIRHNITEIKSTEGVDICWVEEAEAASEESWQILDPTIRKDGSEIWVTFNPRALSSPTYQRFIVDPPPDCKAVKLSYADNPWFSETSEKQRLWTLKKDPAAYDWIWEGNVQQLSEAIVFRGRFDIEPFDIAPEFIDRYYYGADWGFAEDPTCLIRCFILDDVLYIDYEAYAVGVELDDIPALFAGGYAKKNGQDYPGVPGARDWPIYADCARPETISYIARRGFNISAADKWQGSVEDGITALKAFSRIKIHPRCENTATEFRLYSYKQDPKTNEIFPKLEDKWNHCIAAGQLIETARGKIPVDQVRVGDRVLTRGGYRDVYASRRTDNGREWWRLGAGGRTLLATRDHEVWTQRGLVRIDALRYGDCVYILNDETQLVAVPVDVICETGLRGPVYDLSVADDPEFIASGILVSNCTDAIRYGLYRYIQTRGGLGVWARLAS